ncbi:MAG TPA: hypothetical protein VHG28_13625 [Longimicrobiaceae bacterium]|nr:hypothetical protein [Longimicrobiaceae bacterium]
MPETPGIPEAVRRIANANLRYYEGLGRLTVDYVRAMAGLVSDLSASVFPASAPPLAARPAPSPPRESAPAPPGAVLVLEGAAGVEVGGVFRVSNDLRRSVSAPVVLSAFRDESGREHVLPLRVEPAVVELEAGEQTLVEVRGAIPADVEPGVAYRAEITVPGLAAGSVPVVLRRLPDAPGAMEAAETTATPRRARLARRPPTA